MDFSLNDEQQLILDTTREFVTRELYPHEREVEQTGVLRPELQAELKAKAIDAGLYAANMPAEVGGAGLDTVTWALYEKELGRTAVKDMLPMQPGDVAETFADIEALERDTGFRPQTPVDEGVRRFVEWYRAYYAVA